MPNAAEELREVPDEPDNEWSDTPIVYMLHIDDILKTRNTDLLPLIPQWDAVDQSQQLRPLKLPLDWDHFAGKEDDEWIG